MAKIAITSFLVWSCGSIRGAILTFWNILDSGSSVLSRRNCSTEDCVNIVKYAQRVELLLVKAAIISDGNPWSPNRFDIAIVGSRPGKEYVSFVGDHLLLCHGEHNSTGLSEFGSMQKRYCSLSAMALAS